jgi:hypothetical protein
MFDTMHATTYVSRAALEHFAFVVRYFELPDQLTPLPERQSLQTHH